MILTVRQVEVLSAGQNVDEPSTHVSNSRTSPSGQTLHWNLHTIYHLKQSKLNCWLKPEHHNVLSCSKLVAFTFEKIVGKKLHRQHIDTGVKLT